MSSAETAALVTRSAIRCAGIRQPRAEGKQVALDALEHRHQLRIIGRRARADQATHSARRPRRTRPRADRPWTRAYRRTIRSHRRRRSWCKFSRLDDYKEGSGRVRRGPTRSDEVRVRAGSEVRTGFAMPACRRMRQTIPAAAARLVSTERARSALAADHRSVSHPGVRGDAAADAGRSRAAEIRGVAGKVPDVRGARGGAGGRCHRDVAAARLQHPPPPAARDRAGVGRALRRVLPADESTLRSFKGIGEYTAGAVLQLRLRPARGHPRHQRRARAVSCLRRARTIPRRTR